MNKSNIFLLLVLTSWFIHNLTVTDDCTDCLGRIYADCPNLASSLQGVPEQKKRVMLLGLLAKHSEELTSCPQLACLNLFISSFERCVIDQKRAILVKIEAFNEEEQALHLSQLSHDHERVQDLAIRNACLKEKKNHD